MKVGGGGGIVPSEDKAFLCNTLFKAPVCYDHGGGGESGISDSVFVFHLSFRLQTPFKVVSSSQRGLVVR